MKKSDYTLRMNKAFRGMLTEAFRLSIGNPPLAGFILRLAMHQRTAARKRRRWADKGVQVPPYIIASITESCNLRCKGCYAMAKGAGCGSQLDDQKLKSIIREAGDLGVSVFMLAGGEPLLRPGLLDITAEFPKMLFPVFTNGTLLNDELLHKMKAQKNVIPVLSLEGNEEATDARRGPGVYRKLKSLMDSLKNSLFYGVSITVTRHNFDTVTDAKFVRDLIASGCRLVFYVEYVPFKAGTEDWVLTTGQKAKFGSILRDLRSGCPALIIAFPEDEAEYGGCLSSARGFVHISPQGDLEPCPFAPYSDANLKEVSLKDALRSRLLETIRRDHGKLDETKGGCALWENREWVRTIKEAGKGS